jgi:hypothetical protein
MSTSGIWRLNAVGLTVMIRLGLLDRPFSL